MFYVFRFRAFPGFLTISPSFRAFFSLILFLVPHVKLQLGRLNDEEGMRHQIDHAVGLYDSLETSRVSEHSLASAYHILATSFMTTVSTDTDSE